MVKNLTCNVGDPDLIPESGRSPGEGNSSPLQYYCLKNSMDRELGGLQPTGSQTDTTKRLTVHLVFFKNKNRSKENVIG